MDGEINNNSAATKLSKLDIKSISMTCGMCDGETNNNSAVTMLSKLNINRKDIFNRFLFIVLVAIGSSVVSSIDLGVEGAGFDSPPELNVDYHQYLT